MRGERGGRSLAGAKMEREIRGQPEALGLVLEGWPEALATAGTLRERGFRSVSHPKPPSRRKC